MVKQNGSGRSLRKALAFVLSLAMVVTMFPSTVFAQGQKWEGTVKGENIVRDTVTRITDTVCEHEVVTNNAKGDNQKIDYICEIGKSDSIKLAAGYGQDSAKEWSLTATSSQAKAYEKNHPGETVVAAINADFFNMATGEPRGVLVMEGEKIKDATGDVYFGVKKDGTPVIRNDLDVSDLEMAVGGESFYLVENGRPISKSSPYGSLHYSRTAIGIKADGTIVTFVTHGNRAPASNGRTYAEISEMLAAEGCETAVALDGGGSSTFLARHEGTDELVLRNKPVDGAERQVSSSILVVSTAVETGVFDHAQISPVDELYTQDSKVQFSAKGVDTAGFPVALPEGTKWMLADSSSSLGTIDARTGEFVSNGTLGKVNVNLVDRDGKAVGSTSVDIVAPDHVYFATEEVSLGFDDSSDLGLVVRYKNRDVHYKDGDFNWSFEYNDEYKESLFGAKRAAADIGALHISAAKTGTAGNDLSVKIEPNKDLGAEDGAKVITVMKNGKDLETFKKYKKAETKDQYIKTVDDLVNNVKSDNVIFTRNGDNTLTDNAGTALAGGTEPSSSPDLGLIGKFTGNTFNTYDKTATGTMTATYAKTEKGASGSLSVVVGKMPTVVWDFEDVKNPDGTVTPAEDYYVGNKETGTKGILSTSNYGRGGKQSIDIVSMDQEEPVRFGEKSLKLNFDFRDCKEVTEGACIGTSKAMTVPGVPTAIGAWVYAPEGVGIHWDGPGSQAGFWLRGYVKDGTGNVVPYNFTLEPKVIEPGSDVQPGIHWEGWKYVEADLTKLQAPYSIRNGMTFRLMFVNGIKMGTRTADSIYFDNLQFVYGANVDDIDSPEIDSIMINGKEVRDGSTIDRSTVNIDAVAHDVVNKYTSGIDDSTVRMYVDGVNVADDQKHYQYVYDKAVSTAHLYNLKLRDGEHSVTFLARDKFGNEVKETRSFTVAAEGQTGGSSVFVAAGGEKANLGETFDLNINISDDTVVENTTTFKLGNEFNKDYKVTFAEGYEGTTKYNKLEKSITVNVKKKTAGPQTADLIPGGKTVATLTVKVPPTLKKGDSFTYAVKRGSFNTANGGYDTYSAQTKSVPIGAAYTIDADPILTGGADGVIRVTDANGNAAEGVNVYLASDNSLIGKTDAKGQVSTNKLNANAGSYTVYAKDDKGALSFHTSILSYEAKGDPTGKPHDIRFNITKDPTSQKNVTWMSNPLAEGQQTFQYKAAGSADWKTAQGVKTTQLNFDTHGFASINVSGTTITGLAPGTTYDYRAGTGANVTEGQFSTAAAGKSTSDFFVIGDIQDPDKANTKAIIEKLMSGKSYDFCAQIGDAVDQAGDYQDWSDLGDILGAKMLGGTDMLSVMGNHEYYGDSDGSNGSVIYNNPDTGAASYYSTQYGDVYMAVINFGDSRTDIKAATEWLRQDAKKHDATWKLVFTHQPPYYTNSVGGNKPVYDYLPAVAEEVGIDAVFSGHDHSVARTNRLTKDKIDEKNGVLYYICGATGGKRYPMTTQGEFDYDTIFKYVSDDYNATYVTASADADKMTIKIHELTGNALLDEVTIKSRCSANDHFKVYDPAKNEVKCTRCGQVIKEYTGDVKDAQGNEYYLIGGKMQTGWKAVGEEMRYYNDKGIREEVTVEETKSTCLINGSKKYTSASGAVTETQNSDAGGHQYIEKDGKWVCEKCGWTRIDIDKCNVELSYDACPYTGKARMPQAKVTDPETGYVLTDDGKKKDRDFRKEYMNNVEVGTAQIKVIATRPFHFVNKNDWRGNAKGEQILTFEIRPDAPQNAQLKLSKGQYSLTWDKAKMADRYAVYESVNGSKAKLIGTTTGTSYKLKKLDPRKGYSYYVYSRKTAADGKTYQSLTAARDTERRAAIYVETSKGENSGKPVVEWNKVLGATYQVYRSTNPNTGFTRVASTSGTSYVDWKAVPERTYYYKVRLIKADVGITSKAFRRTCGLAKTTLTASTDLNGKPRITWKKVTGADRYMIYAAPEKGSYKKIYTTKGTALTHSSAVRGKTYSYKVIAVSDRSTTLNSTSAAVKQFCRLDRPQVKITHTMTGHPKVSWNKVAGADRYKVYRAIKKDGPYKMMFETKGTAMTNTSTTPKHEYFYKVMAISDENYDTRRISTIAEAMCFIPAPEPEISLSAAGKPAIKWNAVEGADRYILYVKEKPEDKYKMLVTTKFTSCVNSRAVSGKKYYYRVRAVVDEQETANSVASAEVSIISK